VTDSHDTRVRLDLPGAKGAVELDGVQGIGITRFSSKDVVRHPLVQRIVEAYDQFESAKAKPQNDQGEQ